MKEKEIIDRFRTEYVKWYKDILPPEMLKAGNPFYEKFLIESMREYAYWKIKECLPEQVICQCGRTIKILSNKDKIK